MYRGPDLTSRCVLCILALQFYVPDAYKNLEAIKKVVHF
jgi:hypothetical protein